MRTLKTLFLLTSLIFTIALFDGCKKDKEQSEQTLTANPNKGEYKHYEICAIRVSANLGKDSFLTAMVSGKTARLAVADDSTLALTVMPDLFSIGENVIEFELANKKLKTTVKVISSTSLVTDPTETFTKFSIKQNDLITGFETMIQGDTQLKNNTEVSKVIAQAKKAMTDFQTEITKMSPEEQLAFANFIEVNNATFESIRTNLNTSLSFLASDHGMIRRSNICTEGTPVEKYKCHWLFLKDRLVEVTYAGTIALAAASTIKFTGLAGLGVSAVASALATPSLVAAALVSAKLIVIHFKIVGFLVSDVFFDASEQRRSTPISFYKNTATPFPINMQLRNVQAIDNATKLNWLGLGMKAINKFNNLCDKLRLKDFKFMFGSETSVNTNPFSLSHLSVGNISNSSVSLVLLGGTAQLPELTFNSNSTQEQTFTFDLTYNDGVNLPVTITLDGVVKEPQPVNIISATVFNNTAYPGEVGETVHSNSISFRISFSGAKPTQIAILTDPNATPQETDWKPVTAGNNTLDYIHQAQFGSLGYNGWWNFRIFLRSGSLVSTAYEKQLRYTTVVSHTPVSGNENGVPIYGIPAELADTVIAGTQLTVNPNGGIVCGSELAMSQLMILNLKNLQAGLRYSRYSSFTFLDGSGVVVTGLNPSFATYTRKCHGKAEPSPFTAIQYVEISYK